MTDPKPTVPQVLPIMRAFQRLPGNSVGGCLHVVLDDGNIDDWFVQDCLDEATREGDTACAELAGLLLRMSKTQRRKLAWLFYAKQEPNYLTPIAKTAVTPID